MRVSSLILCLASICSAVPAPASVPQAPDSELQSEAYQTWTTTLPEPLRNALSEFKEPSSFEKTPDPAIIERWESDISKRGTIERGKRYSLAGWVFTIGAYIVQEVGSTSWVFPQQSDWSARNWLADDVTTSIRSTFGDGFHIQNIGGGWTWSGQIGNGYEFQDIPYEALYRVFMDSIETAMDWISQENYLAFQLIDNAGVQIGIFALYPTNGDLNSVRNYHND